MWKDILKATPKRKKERAANQKKQQELNAKAGLHNIKDEREVGTWNAYIKDFYTEGESKWPSLYEASRNKRQVHKDVETDSQDETYKRFYERALSIGFDITGNKNEGAIQMLVEGFMTSASTDSNFYYVISQKRPSPNYRVNVDLYSAKHLKEKFGDATYEQLQDM